MKTSFISFMFATTIFFSLLVSMVPSNKVYAIKLLNTDNIENDAERFGNTAGYAIGERDPIKIVSTLINAFLGLLGVLFLGLIIYGGFRWMNAQGNEEDVTKAKEIITQAVIGLAVIVAAYAISYFVVENLQNKTLRANVSEGDADFVGPPRAP